MQYLYAALLLHNSGKEINEENLKKVVEAAGAQADEARIKTVVASLKGVDIEKALKEATTVATAPSPKEEVKKEKKAEEKKEEAAEGLSALFG